jgi:hypothetical protein
MISKDVRRPLKGGQKTMSSCNVYVYDDALAALSSTTTEIAETDGFGTNLDVKTARTLGSGEFGEAITLPVPAIPISVWIDDTSSIYAPASLTQLNGGLTARLDIIVYTLPVPSVGSGGGGQAATWQIACPTFPDIRYSDFDQVRIVEPMETTDPIAARINSRVNNNDWTSSEGMAVRSLVDTVRRAQNCPNLSSSMKKRLTRWLARLDELGINISGPSKPLTPPAKRSQGGSHNPPTATAAT